VTGGTPPAGGIPPAGDPRPPGGPRPVVYLGPSAPPEDIRAILPDAVIRPPLRRGDLYRDRMLHFSRFLIVDGVFSQDDAVPPREVVDVLQDGALVVGAASMGALRATDCAPAGAVGAGLIHRLFSAGVLASEDEVAVLFDPDAPFPALSESLVNMRLALRQAIRDRVLDRAGAEAVARAAGGLHFSRRGWQAAFRAAGLAGSWPALRDRLTAHDAKRADAAHGARTLARLTLQDTAHRRRRPGLLGRAGQAREREADPLRGRDEAAEAPRFTFWMLAGGRGTRYVANSVQMLKDIRSVRLDIGTPGVDCPAGFLADAEMNAAYAVLSGALHRDGEFHAEWFRHFALDAEPGPSDGAGPAARRLAELRIAAEHGLDDWPAVLAAAGDAAGWCEWARDRIAGATDRRRLRRGSSGAKA
jgi:hypothetical protein